MKTRSPMTGRSGLQMGGSTRLFQFLVCVERTIEHILVVLVFRVHFAAPRVLSRCLRSRCSVHIVTGRGGWGVLLHPEVPSRLDCLVFRGYRSPASDLDSQAPPQHRHIPRQSSLGIKRKPGNADLTRLEKSDLSRDFFSCLDFVGDRKTFFDFFDFR